MVDNMTERKSFKEQWNEWSQNKRIAFIVFCAVCLIVPMMLSYAFTASTRSVARTDTYTVSIESNTSWSGSVGADMQSRTEQGFGSQTFQLNGQIIVVVMQKQTAEGYLTVCILKNGQTLASQTTTAEYGVLSVSYPY